MGVIWCVFHVSQRRSIVLHWHIYDEASTKETMLKIGPPMTWLWSLEVHVFLPIVFVVECGVLNKF